jgi:translocation and assembly module TamA
MWLSHKVFGEPTILRIGAGHSISSTSDPRNVRIRRAGFSPPSSATIGHVNRFLTTLMAALVVMSALPSMAAVEVEIVGLSDELLLNVEAHLDLKKRGRDEGLSEVAIRRLYAGADEKIRAALRPFGYYNPQIDGRLEAVDGGWVARFEIDPGPPVILEEVDLRITGEGLTDPDFVALLDEPGLDPGEPLDHPGYDQLKSRLAQIIADNGYFEADFTRHELRVDPANLRATAHIHLDTGPRYRLGAIRVEQDFLDERVIARVINVKPGELFDGIEVRETEYALYAMGYFSVVEIASNPDPETNTVSLTFTLAPTRRHRWTAGGGYSTDTNIYLRGGWHNRLVNRRGHRMGIDLRLSTPMQDLLYRYVFPTGRPEERLTVLAGLIREERGDTLSNRIEIAPVHSGFWGEWQRDLFGIAQAEKSDISEIRFNDFWLIPGMRAIRTNWNDLMRPTRGYKVSTEVRGSFGFIGSPTEYVQIHVRSSLYLPVKPKLRWYFRGELGATAVDDFDALPVSQRFFAGGDRSVRGFGLNQLSPVDAEGDLIGGRHLAFVSAELEYDVRGPWTIDVFADAGNAFDHFGDPLEYSVGVGLRWRSPIGLIGGDVAQALSVDGQGLRLHFSVRPEL